MSNTIHWIIESKTQGCLVDERLAEDGELQYYFSPTCRRTDDKVMTFRSLEAARTKRDAVRARKARNAYVLQVDLAFGPATPKGHVPRCTVVE